MACEIHIAPAIRRLCGSHGVEVAISTLAERQDGVVGRAQVLSLGLSESAIERRIKGGRLHRLWPGVYAVGHRRLSQRGRWMAAVLAGGERAVLVTQSAAALHGFAPDDTRTVHVRAKRRDRPGLRFHTMSLAKNEVTTRDGIPTTTAARTLLDLAAHTPAPKLERALREALFTGATALPPLGRLLLTHQGERGAGALARAVQEAKDAPGHFRSNKEQRFKNWLKRQRLPMPKFNAEIEVNGGRLEVDCYWPTFRLVAEIDDRSTHARRKSFESDRIRDRTLQANSLRVIRIAEPYDAGLRADLERLLRRAV